MEFTGCLGINASVAVSAQPPVLLRLSPLSGKRRRIVCLRPGMKTSGLSNGELSGELIFHAINDIVMHPIVVAVYLIPHGNIFDQIIVELIIPAQPLSSIRSDSMHVSNIFSRNKIIFSLVSMVLSNYC